MSEPKLTRTKRHLPHWQMQGSTYYVTFRLKAGELTDDERQLVFNHLIDGDAQYYKLIAAVVMPDHVHAILRPIKPYTLSRVMQGTKGVTAKWINQARQTRGPLWLGESFDRILRDEEELVQKARYLLENPVRAGLAHAREAYPYRFDALESEA